MQLSLLRADDQLSLNVRTYNLTAERAGSGYELRPTNSAQPSFLAVTFPPQHLIEYAATETKGRKSQAKPIFTNESRVVFRIPPGAAPIPLSVSGILEALCDLELMVHPTAGTINEAPAPPGASASAAQLLAAAMAPPPAPGAGGRENGSAVSPNGTGSLPADGLRAELAVRAAARLTVTSDAMDEAVIAPVTTVATASAATGRATAAASATIATATVESPGTQAAAIDPDEATTDPEDAAPTESDAMSATGPAPVLTVLNFPSELTLSPAGGATRFVHAATPVANGKNVELWHSRLMRRTKAGGVVERTVSVIARRMSALSDVDVPPLAFADSTINSPLTHGANLDIIKQTSESPPLPKAAKLRSMMLSPLGAWLDVDGSWPGRSVESWRHRLAMGRDQRVQVVQKGLLYPFGHEAVMTSSMERRFTERRNGSAAELLTRMIIRVKDPSRDFGATADTNVERRWPWKTIELLTQETPPGLVKTVVTDSITGKRALFILPEGESVQAFEFECMAVDRGENVSIFAVPLLFVEDGFTNFAGLRAWLSSSDASTRGFGRIDLQGQTVALAPSVGASTPPDTTTVVANTAALAVETGGSLGLRPVVPYVDGIVPALARFAGAAGSAETRVSLAQAYVDHGFDQAKNAGQALFSFAGPVIDLAGGKSGGLISPKFAIIGLSREIGLIGGDPSKAVESLARVALGRFDVQKWLSGALDSCKLFGVFKLTDLIPDDLDLLANAPRMVTQALDGISSQRLTWDVPLFGKSATVSVPGVPARLQRIAGAPEPRLFIQAVGSVDPVTGHVRSETICQVTNVELVLSLAGSDIVTVPLKRLKFKTADGEKPDVDCDLGTIGFGGILSFVATLASLIDSAGFNDPPALEMLQEGVRSSFSAPVPSVSVGMFCLENITFGAALSVYFNGQPVELALNFATFENPFRLSVSALAGGGYLAVKVNTRGLQQISGALEFGAALSVNLGIARGSISAMGGIYFMLEHGDATLTGYLRIRGELDVLGLISVGVELMLAMTYVSETQKVEGYAEMAVRVKVLFFRKTVRIQFHKQFAGANGDPTFAELMAPDGWTGALPWDDYCTAFVEA